jgi:hypothetical protein
LPCPSARPVTSLAGFATDTFMMRTVLLAYVSGTLKRCVFVLICKINIAMHFCPCVQGTSVDVRYPYAFLITFCLLGAVCGTLLPETLDQKLPDTLEDSAEFGADQKFWSCPQRNSNTRYKCTPNK